ncbi:helix-turn-helix domain-containing protein [Actinomyces dentalis]|uniref:helix-turn-helix domain-containing protein n=1 Tax=Actinomyces dentalis TaxID=272548 RepID=UPI003CCC296D
MRLRAMELIADGWSASAAARELGVSHTAVQRWARGAGVGLAMGAVGGSALAAARRRRAVFEAWAAGAGRAGAARAGGVSIRTAGRWLHDTRMSTPARPVAAVESAHGGEVLRRGRRGGALRPSDHRGPDARVSGRAGRGLRLGAGERAMIATGLAQGDLGRPHRPPDRPVPADRVPRDPPRGRRGAGSTAGRRRRPRPGRPWPAPRSASWTPIRPCASGSSTRPGDRAGPQADRRPSAVREPR